jgi:tetratricopeptide (TPR) repeat protein
LQYVRNAAHDAGDEVWERELLVRLGQLYRKTERLVEAQRYLGEVLKVSRASGNFRTVADTLYHLGTVSWDEGDNKVSRIYHQEAVEISTALGLTDIVAVQAHHGMGEALLKAGYPQDALNAFTRSLALAQQIGDVSYESENLQMMGWTALGLFGIGDHARAKVNFIESLALSEAAHLEWHSICCLIGLGLAEGVTGNYEQGLTRIEHGRRMAEALHVDRFIAMGLDCLGELYLDLHRYAEAEALHRQAIQMMMRAESTYWLPRLQGNYAIARMRQGDFNVEDDLHSILEVALVRNQEAHAFRCFEALAELYVARGHAGSALRYADQLLRLAETGDLRELQASACRWRGEAFLVSGDLDAAETALNRALAHALDVGRVRLIVDIYAALARLSRQRNDDDAAARHDSAARRVCADIIALHQDVGIRARVLSAYAL